jgi:tetratricopeptide (TPR) repeat protein
MLQRLQMLATAGEYRAALELARSLRQEAAEAGATAIELEALFRAGLLEKRFQLARASEHLTEAATAARAAGHDALAAKASLALAERYADLGELEAARTWLRHGRAATSRAGDPPELLDIVEATRAAIALFAGQRQEAIAAMRASVGHATGHHGPEHPTTVRRQGSLASYLVRDGQLDAGAELAAEVLASTRAIYGAQHPDTASAHADLAMARLRLGEYAAAVVEYEAALSILGHDPDANPANVVANEAMMGMALRGAGRLEDALAAQLRAQATMERDPEYDRHPNRAIGHEQIALTLLQLVRPADALEHARTAQTLYEQAYGGPTALAIGARQSEVDALLELSRLDEAQAVYARLEPLVDAPEVMPRQRLVTLTLGARVDLAADRPQAAIERLATPQANIGDYVPAEQAEIHYWLSRAHAAAGDATKARALARLAREALAPLGDSAGLDELDAWISELGVAEVAELGVDVG